MKGSLLVESMMAVSVMAIVSITMMPMVAQISRTADSADIYSKLVVAADYAGQYMESWAQIPPNQKPLPLSYYMESEGKEFDITGDKRINSMPWTQALVSQGEFLKDEYKVSITFWETSTRSQSAVVKVLVWYDEDLDGILDTSERKVSFTTVLSETQPA